MSEKSVKILNCSGDAKKVIEKIDSSKLLNLDNKNCTRMICFCLHWHLVWNAGYRRS